MIAQHKKQLRERDALDCAHVQLWRGYTKRIAKTFGVSVEEIE